MLVFALGFVAAVLSAVGFISYAVVYGLYQVHPFLVAVLPVLIIFGTCTMIWLVYGAWAWIGDATDWWFARCARKRAEDILKQRTMVAGVIDRNVQ